MYEKTSAFRPCEPHCFGLDGLRLKMARHSKLQKNILAIYKQFLRCSQDKPGTRDFVKSEFRKNSTAIAKTDVLRVEYLYRRAEKQLKLIQNDSVKDMGVFREWWAIWSVKEMLKINTEILALNLMIVGIVIIIFVARAAVSDRHYLNVIYLLENRAKNG